MTGLVGIFFRDGQGANPEHLSRPLAAIAERGGGPTEIHVAGSCALGAIARPVTPEDLGSGALVVDAATGVAVVLDGRLDDRPSLIARLRSESLEDASRLSDAQLALASYLHAGTGFASGLIGDFALVVWDPRHQRIICVRDPSGIRPLYYALSKGAFICASNPRSILAHPTVSRRVNHAMLGEYLAVAFTSKQDTLYAEVSRLPPAHRITVDARRSVTEQYWAIDPHRRIRYRNLADYAEQFLDLFRRAVADRLRAIAPIGVALSGGMDSSAVAGVAQQLLNEDGVGARVHAYSLTYPGDACDESPYIDAVVERWGLVSRRCSWTRFESCPWPDQVAQYLDFPEYPTQSLLAGLYRLANADGVQVLLTGEGGDHWQNGSSLPHRHLLEALQLADLFREIRCEARRTGVATALRLLVGSLSWGLIPAGLRRRIESRRRTRSLPPFLPLEFARATGLEQRLHRDDCADRFGDASQWQIVKQGRSGAVSHIYELIDRSAVGHGVELRHPLLDPRIIEFAVAIPDPMRRRGSIERLLLRQAMSTFYPDAVSVRTDKASPGIVMARALTMPEVERVLTSADVLERPWVKPDVYPQFLQTTLASCRSGNLTNYLAIVQLWMLFAVEIWYREAAAA